MNKISNWVLYDKLSKPEKYPIYSEAQRSGWTQCVRDEFFSAWWGTLYSHQHKVPAVISLRPGHGLHVFFSLNHSPASRHFVMCLLNTTV